jgi:small-conductance mechanosensitive channel
VTYSALGPLSSLLQLEGIDQKDTFVSHLEREIDVLQKSKLEQEEEAHVYKVEFEVAQSVVNALRERSKKVSDVELDFVNAQLVLANQTMQALTEIDQSFQYIINTIDSHIKLLQDYKQDPDFKNKHLAAGPKSLYTLDDLQKITYRTLLFDEEIKTFEERLKKTSLDLENRKKTQALARQEYEEKRKELREFKNRDESKNFEGIGRQTFTVQQQAELLDGQERLLRYRKELAEIRVKEVDIKAQFLREQIRITALQAEIVAKEYERIKREVHIDEKDIKAAESALKNQIQESTKKQEEFNNKIEATDVLRANELAKIANYKKKYNLTDADIEAISQWVWQPTTISGWNALIDIGRAKNKITYSIDIHRDYCLAQIDVEKVKISIQEIAGRIVNSWHKLTLRKLDRQAQDELLKEIKQYEKIKADLQAHMSLLIDKRANAAQALNSNMQIIEHIKEKIKELKEAKGTLFKNKTAEFNRCMVHLKDELNEDMHQRGEAIAQLIELYTNTGSMLMSQVKKIDMIIDELKLKTQWRATPPLWKGIQSFIPDIKRFFSYIFEKDIHQSIAVNQQTAKELIGQYGHSISGIISLIVQMAILLLLFMLIKLYLPDVKKLLSRISPQFGIGHTISSFMIALLSFVGAHLGSMFIWYLCFLAIRYHVITDTYTGVIFYLVSIIYWLAQAYKFIRYIAQENIEKNYIFATKRYQRRFLTVFSIFLYVTISILLFREAFVWARFFKSDVPTMLLALNFILLQISLICLIGREQILNIIPRTTPLWQWIYDHVEHYYYLFLAGAIFIIVMSNPYVGYGPQFFYILTRLLLILLLIPFFTAIHNQIKRLSGSLFFYTDGDVIKERFTYGRTLYGIFVISTFLFFCAVAFIIAANIWDYHIGLHDISDWLHKEIYPIKDLTTGRPVAVSALSLFKVVLYIFGGMIIAYGINKFVLGRMFDLLLVNIGVQNAILSLTRYIIVLGSIIIGLQSVGLNTSLLYLFAVLGGLGVAGKEFISDFIGYFVILIQRPIKIGDLIRIDGDVTGVVRHVNLRSVVLRRKNSVTVIVPNSHVMTRPVVNWSYTRTFFAFDDILLTIPYSADAVRAKELILKVLYSNMNILKNPAPIVWLNEFTENGFQFLVRGFLSPDKVLDQFEIASDVRFEIVRILRAHNMEVASPTRVLRVVQQAGVSPLDTIMPSE